jgi:hypothetical protein
LRTLPLSCTVSQALALSCTVSHFRALFCSIDHKPTATWIAHQATASQLH